MTTKTTKMKPSRKSRLPRKPDLGEWRTFENAYLNIRSGSRALIVGLVRTIDSPKIAVVAVESAAKATESKEVLDDHSHADLGFFKSAKRAKAAAEAFARKWIVAKVRSPKCKCDEISTS
jgi:hypothetical protein